MAVQARFYVNAVEKYANGQTRPGYADPAPMGKVKLSPVTRGEANKEWASATPSGSVEMTIHSDALGWFEGRLGQELKITFEDRPTEETA